jgi:hypothetical protein
MIQQNDQIIIPNIDQYMQQIINGNLVLTKIISYISENDLFQKNLRNSKILECKINGNNINVNKYKKLLIHVYSDMDTNIIIQNTILNITTEKIWEKGFEYHDTLNISIQGADAKRTLREIIKMISVKNHTMELKIKLNDDEIINYKTHN